MNQHYSNLNWVTNGLSEEILYAFSANTDINVINNNERDMSKFKEKLTKFVFTGRYFASPLQSAPVMKKIVRKGDARSFISIVQSSAIMPNLITNTSFIQIQQSVANL